MTKNKYTVWFFAALAAAIFLNALLTFLVTGSREYVDVQGAVMSRKQIREAEEMLAGYDYSEYGAAYDAISQEYSALKRYEYIMDRTDNGAEKLKKYYNTQNYSDEQVQSILNSFNYSMSEAQSRLNMLTYCMERLNYVKLYPVYVDQVVSSAALMADVSIFSDSAIRRIVKTGQDFYGHENIRVSAFPDIGVKAFFSDWLTDLIALCMSFACALIYHMRCHTGASRVVLLRSRSGAFAAAFACAVALLYVTGAVVGNFCFSLGDLGRSIQSITDFYTCPYMISVGMLLAARIAFKTLACLILYLFLTGVLFCRSRMTAFLIVLAAVLGEVFLTTAGAGISLYSAFHSERFILSYSRIPIFGETMNTGWMLTAFLLCLLGAAFYFAGKNVSAELLVEKEKREQIYFEEINSRYTETRLIRHDIHNHLTAIAMLMDEGNVKEARQYLGMVSEQLDEAKPPVKTGSSVLDAVLFGKAKDAKEKGIPLELSFMTHFADSAISDYDLCSVFGNLLDNAIEACEKLPGEDRRIALSVKKQADMICVYCENKYQDIQRENGGFVTSKTDKGAHGLGLKRIRRIAEKYNGTMEIRTEDGVFSISVLFVP